MLLRNCNECAVCVGDTDDADGCLLIQTAGGVNRGQDLLRIVLLMCDTSRTSTHTILHQQLDIVEMVAKSRDPDLLSGVCKFIEQEKLKKQFEEKREEERLKRRERKKILNKLNKPYMISVEDNGYVFDVVPNAEDDTVQEFAESMDETFLDCMYECRMLSFTTKKQPEEFIALLEKNAKPEWLKCITFEGVNAKKRKIT
jgi:hypothetical protein